MRYAKHLLAILLATLALALVACDGTATAFSASSAASIVRVNFSNAKSLNDFTATTAVNRTAPDSGVAAYALSELIAGPTPLERSNQGLFSEWNSMFTGPAKTVGGPDFTIKIVNGVATVQFTRTIASPGISEITATLLQFSSIKSVVILTVDGKVFGNLQGTPPFSVQKVVVTTLSTWKTGAYIQAVFTVVPGPSGGVIDFAYSMNNGRSSTPEHLTILPGQTKTDFVFTWQGALPADHTQPGQGRVEVTSSNVILSNAVGPV